MGMFAGITWYYEQFSKLSQVNKNTLCKQLYIEAKLHMPLASTAFFSLAAKFAVSPFVFYRDIQNTVAQ